MAKKPFCHTAFGLGETPLQRPEPYDKRVFIMKQTTCADCGKIGPCHDHHVLGRDIDITVPLCPNCHHLIHDNLTFLEDCSESRAAVHWLQRKLNAGQFVGRTAFQHKLDELGYNPPPLEKIVARPPKMLMLRLFPRQ
jgi:hypothetical protein